LRLFNHSGGISGRPSFRCTTASANKKGRAVMARP
jgi:hypothetical protein